MSYRADAAKHICTAAGGRWGERTSSCVVYAEPLLPQATPCWTLLIALAFGTTGTELARKLLIFLCESAQNTLFHTKYLKFSGEGHSRLPDPTLAGKGDTPPQTLPPRRPLRLDSAPLASRPRRLGGLSPHSKNSGATSVLSKESISITYMD